ncbi:hypothetical protein ACJX0J_031391, partial [Zea mays]
HWGTAILHLSWHDFLLGLTPNLTPCTKNKCGGQRAGFMDFAGFFEVDFKNISMEFGLHRSSTPILRSHQDLLSCYLRYKTLDEKSVWCIIFPLSFDFPCKLWLDGMPVLIH